MGRGGKGTTEAAEGAAAGQWGSAEAAARVAGSVSRAAAGGVLEAEERCCAAQAAEAAPRGRPGSGDRRVRRDAGFSDVPSGWGPRRPVESARLVSDVTAEILPFEYRVMRG